MINYLILLYKSIYQFTIIRKDLRKRYTHRKRPNRVLVYHSPCVCCPYVPARGIQGQRLSFLCVYACLGELILTGQMGFSQLNLIMSISKEFGKNKPPKIIFTYNSTNDYLKKLYFLTLF